MVLGSTGGWGAKRDRSEKKSKVERWALGFVDWICGGVLIQVIRKSDSRVQNSECPILQTQFRAHYISCASPGFF
ncbi:hypothetical protein PRUPE_4G288700 [Prunus persica]|uniref:Uncharacterized protein n=1 Tax=Prunus persica TaxID=3760 RepID=A0A251PSU0_PRUPE|nr:hypothetical protein PRUPE_4G288700 [Prunus persica]